MMNKTYLGQDPDDDQEVQVKVTIHKEFSFHIPLRYVDGDGEITSDGMTEIEEKVYGLLIDQLDENEAVFLIDRAVIV
jgi:hypothetical protein